MQLALGKGVALLHLRTAFFHRPLVVRLAGPGGTADAVAPRTPADQYHHIAAARALAHHILTRGGANHCANLHPLRLVSPVVYLVHQPCRQADLVAIGRISVRRLPGDLPLGQLVLHGILQALARVAAAGHAHCLVHIRTARERIADCAAQAGCRTAKRLDLRWVVVRFVFEHDQVITRAILRINCVADRAGVDLLTLIKVLQLVPAFRVLGVDGRKVHQADVLFAAQVAPHIQVFLVHALRLARNIIICKCHVF